MSILSQKASIKSAHKVKARTHHNIRALRYDSFDIIWYKHKSFLYLLQINEDIWQCNINEHVLMYLKCLDKALKSLFFRVELLTVCIMMSGKAYLSVFLFPRGKQKALWFLKEKKKIIQKTVKYKYTHLCMNTKLHLINVCQLIKGAII